jgi:hypothetical protein
MSGKGRLSRGQGANASTSPDGYNFDNVTTTQSLSDTGLIGPAWTRPSGLLFGTVVGVVSTFTAPTTSIQLILEGSHDAVEGSVGSGTWFVIAETIGTGNFTATGTKTLNPDLGDVVDFQRWKMLRLRVVNTGGGVIAVSGTIIGRALAGEAHVYQTAALTRTAATVNDTGEVRFRSSIVTCGYVRFSAAGHSAGSDSVTCNFQGSYDNGTTWVTLASGTATPSGGAQTVALTQDGNTLMNLAGYDHIRLQLVDNGTNTYTAIGYFGMDSCDVRAGLYGEGDSTAELLTTMDCTVSGSAGAQDAFRGIAVTFQVKRLDGSPLLAARTLQVIVSDTLNAGAGDLATNAVVSGVTTGTLVAGSGSNRATVTTNTSGVAVVTITDAVNETVYAMMAADGDGVPSSSSRFQVVQTDQTVCAYS